MYYYLVRDVFKDFDVCYSLFISLFFVARRLFSVILKMANVADGAKKKTKKKKSSKDNETTATTTTTPVIPLVNDDANDVDDAMNKREGDSQKTKEKKRKLREERNEAATLKAESIKQSLSDKQCKICQNSRAITMFSAKQLLKTNAACIECSNKRASEDNNNVDDDDDDERKQKRLKKMTKREKLDAAIQRRKDLKEEKKKLKPLVVADDAITTTTVNNNNNNNNNNNDNKEKDINNKEKEREESVPQKMVPSTTERDLDESDEIAKRSMYCGGIPFHKSEDEIKAAFVEEGLEVEKVDCMLFADSGRFRGIAIITFNNVSDRDEALKFDGEDWEGFSMVCRPYKVKKTNATTAPKEEPKKIDGQRVAFVANLDYSVTEELLRETFAQGSDIKEIRMGLDKETQDFKGFAHIEFVSDGDLVRALKKNGRELLGRELKVTFATERRKSAAVNDKEKETKKRIKKSK